MWVLRRLPDEPWRECVRRIGLGAGAWRTPISIYDEEVARGAAEDEAAWTALEGFGLLDWLDAGDVDGQAGAGKRHAQHGRQGSRPLSDAA